ncbi:Pimeloyl-ACP methyl ester carboxylesterase [Microbulbifer donghaiensis]|uniref:Proline iminopeptidase n=1 Tax=Microbulbifer donghaiensis TaxID=494016 RepID=A0A1M5HNE0_9GAMM|nr:alpha/beta hydrolase [Microbulbifer donghaiensis]SHG17431.1 Pimeloyl-ACP methyl ester carboxylesterase [Microbulbifer donghaiensis]
MADVQDGRTSSSCYLDGWGDALRCYRIAVGLDATAVELSVTVAPAVNDVGREPLYLLAGGPGQAASDLAPLLNAFRRINRERDIVMVDRRGAGHSAAFRCGFERDMPVDLQSFSRQLARCYLQQPQFAEALSSRQAVEDLELVRKTLAHERIALWGGSWGTRTALLYQQWYPDSLSALVLDAVAPIDTKVFLTATAAERAMQILERDCAGDAVCAGLGNWRGDLDQLLAGWNAEMAARFPDPVTGVPAAIPLPRWALANSIRAALYDPAAAAQLPYAIHQASRGNYLPLSGISGLFLNTADGMAMGLTFSVACAEELNRITAEDVVADSKGSFLGSAFYELFHSGCQGWPVTAKPYSVPESRAQPVLLISGEADPITPPYYAEQALAYLSRKQHLVVPGGGHINSRRGCIPELIARFLNAPESPLDQSCVAEIRRPPFMADAFGPALGGKLGGEPQGGGL